MNPSGFGGIQFGGEPKEGGFAICTGSGTLF